jgi:hypothetical protein
MTTRWQLKKKYVFVDALLYQKPEDDQYGGKKKPDSIPYAHVMDKTKSPSDNSPSPTPYLALNPGAGFIGRFIIQGVDTDELLPQILISEYEHEHITLPQAKADVNAVLELMKPYLRPRSHQRKHEAPAKVKDDIDPTGQYPLDFKVNWLGTGFIKGPL